jgi:hypothetical protein
MGGAWGLRHFHASEDEPVLVTVRVDNVSWELELASAATAGRIASGERVQVDDNVMLTRELYAPAFHFKGREYAVNEGTALRKAYEIDTDPVLEPLVRMLRHSPAYHDYRLSKLRSVGSEANSDVQLNSTGDNVFSVLRNWRDQRRFRMAYDFVLEGMKDAFGDTVEDFEFEPMSENVTMRLYLRGVPEPVPAHQMPTGMLVALLHLCAIGGAEEGSVVAIDEIENALHPYAIQELMNAFRDMAERRNVTVLLSTHSPVLLNQFKAEPSQIQIMEVDENECPVPLTRHRDPQWLSRFSLGMLFANLDFGAPTAPQPPSTVS